MKKIIVIIAIVFTAMFARGQGFPGTDSLRTYNSKYITTNPATAFTNNRLHTLIRGIIDWVDTARAGTGGGGAVGMDTLWTINDSTIRYRRNGSFYNHILRGVYDTRRKVDTAYALNDSTLQVKINGTNRNIILPGRHWDLQGILNNGSTLAENENIILADSLQFTSGAVIIETLRIRGITNSIDTTTYKPVAVGPNGATVKLDGWPGSGGSSTTNLDTTRTSSTVTVSSSTGTDAVILGADPLKAGMLTAETQSIAGRKNILGKTSNFNGYGPRLNTQLLIPAKEADSIYAASRYRGFGFCGVFKSGVRVMVFVDADNHVGNHSIVMIGKSYDQGRTYSIDTLLSALPDTCITMGGGGIGPDNRLIIFYKRFKNSDLSPIDQRMVVSDDEGETLYNNTVIGNASNTEYLPYGGLVHGANDVLLLPWYGNSGSTYNVYVIRSSDGGLTWGSPITIFSNTASQRTETSIEHLGGGVMVGLMRSEVGDTLYGQVISYDNGATWAYQGQVSFGINGTPAWLSAFRSQNGKMALACYYRVGTDIRALYSYADSVILGPTHWDLTKEVTIATDVAGSGYINVCHPYQEMDGFGYYYDETVAQTYATIKWVKVPLGGSFPIGVGTGVSGLTTGRIPVASSATSLTDYSTLRYNSSSKAIVLNGFSGDTWDASHNGGVIESAKAAIALNDGGNGVSLLDNLQITTDYTYKTSGLASLFNVRGGSAYFYGVANGTGGTTASLSERLRVGNAGDVWFNGSAGTAGQVPVSGGAGGQTLWTTYVPSQWADVLSGTSINYAGTKVGIRSSSPRATLDVISGANGSGNHDVIFEGDNSAIGADILLGYTSATGTNQRFKGFVMDNNGLNVVKALNNLTGVPTSIAMFTQADNFVVGSTTDNGIGKVQVEGKITVATADSSGSPANMLWRDPNTKEFKLAAVPSGGGNGIYGGSGSLPGNVTVTGGNNSITWSDIFAFNILSDYNTIQKANGTGIYTEAVIGSGNIYELGYTPTAGVFSKGAGLFIDTNNNVGVGTQPPTTIPLYASGASTFVQGFQSNQGNFYRVDNFTANFTAGLTYYFVRIDATSGNVTMTLPAASTAFGNNMGITYVVQRIDNTGNTVTVQRAGSDTINGATSFTLGTQWETKNLTCTSTSTWAQH